jgi:hypothetical protein
MSSWTASVLRHAGDLTPVCRGFLAYPVESAYHRWLHAHAPVVWAADPRIMSGPMIQVRRVPSAISTRAERDSVFHVAQPTASGHPHRLWCAYAAVFKRLHHESLAEEWAERGLWCARSR